jgi:hypothetical protein
VGHRAFHFVQLVESYVPKTHDFGQLLKKMEARRTQCPSRFPGVWRGASDTGESPWRQLRERAEKIPGDKKHDPGLGGFSHGVVALRSSIQHSGALR